MNTTIDLELLLEDIGTVRDAVTREAGMNVPYCESISLSYYPDIVQFAVDPESVDKHEVLDTLRFYTENGLFPSTLLHASLEEFSSYLAEHGDEVFRLIRSEIESYYEDWTGEKLH